MIYRNNDISLCGVEDRYKTGFYEDYDEDEDNIATKCDICRENIYDDEEYYSNGEMNICCYCYLDFYRVD